MEGFSNFSHFPSVIVHYTCHTARRSFYGIWVLWFRRLTPIYLIYHQIPVLACISSSSLRANGNYVVTPAGGRTPLPGLLEPGGTLLLLCDTADTHDGPRTSRVQSLFRSTETVKPAMRYLWHRTVLDTIGISDFSTEGVSAQQHPFNTVRSPSQPGLLPTAPAGVA